MRSGLEIIDRLLSPASVFALRVALLVLSIGSAAMVYRTGDLGAKAVWQGRLQCRSQPRAGGARLAVRLRAPELPESPSPEGQHRVR